jgi:hypothetical protein
MQIQARRDPAFAYELTQPPIELHSKVAVAEHIYDNGIMEDNETGADYVHDFHFAPCVTLPDTVAGDEIPVGSR